MARQAFVTPHITSLFLARTLIKQPNFHNQNVTVLPPASIPLLRFPLRNSQKSHTTSSLASTNAFKQSALLLRPCAYASSSTETLHPCSMNRTCPSTHPQLINNHPNQTTHIAFPTRATANTSLRHWLRRLPPPLNAHRTTPWPPCSNAPQPPSCTNTTVACFKHVINLLYLVQTSLQDRQNPKPPPCSTMRSLVPRMLNRYFQAFRSPLVRPHLKRDTSSCSHLHLLLQEYVSALESVLITQHFCIATYPCPPPSLSEHRHPTRPFDV